VTIAGIQGSGTWTVVENDRPHHLALETDLAFGRLRISYQLAAVDGGRTRFQRDLDFPDLGQQVNAVMEAQSAEGIASLGRLVQRQVPAPAATTIEGSSPGWRTWRRAWTPTGEGAGTGTASTGAVPSPSATRSSASACGAPPCGLEASSRRRAGLARVPGEAYGEAVFGHGHEFAAGQRVIAGW
jgi:hypothetical protein